MNDRESSPLTGLLVVSAILSYALVVFVAVWMLSGLQWKPAIVVIAMLAPSVGLIGAAIIVWQSIRDANRHRPSSEMVPLSIVQRTARILTLASVAFLIFGPIFILICYVNGDIPAFLPHRRKFYPVFTSYELGYAFSLLAAIATSFFALAFAPTWKRAGLLGICIAAFLGFQFWVRSLH
ncbi:MAG: hypothetical protein HY290_15545 [Planctomycetia bacterium]|nr:hypothetical protein [Planctomycetia bacterium]